MAELALEQTAIPGLLVVRLPLHSDARGWFKESWQREKMTALGLPDLGPVQHNVAFNARRGTTRGLHAEPWDKFVSLASGRAFGAWVDLREGDTFGTAVTLDLDPATAVYVPRGVANGYQTLADDTAYVYLVNDHWQPDATYLALDLGDPSLGIAWPIPLADAEVSDKDRAAPDLAGVTPMPPRRTLVLGGDGQLGRALARALPRAHVVRRDELDVTDAGALAAWPWRDYGVIVNAAAYTAVDDAETHDGRLAAWAVNADAPARLARIATEHRLTLVHYSTDYVFDGTAAEHTEDEPLSPLGVYGQSKAAGELAVATTPRHFLLRTTWVIGDGHNFVRTMWSLAGRGVSPSVVDDQVGRLTFADELARITAHLLDTEAPYGTYNATNSGEPASWAALAAEVFGLAGRDPADVTPVSTDQYAADRPQAPRPRSSVLDLSRLRATGYSPRDQWEALRAYCATLAPTT